MRSATGCGGPRRARSRMLATRCRPAPSRARAPTIPGEGRAAERPSLYLGVVDARSFRQDKEPGEVAHALEAFDRRQAAAELLCPLAAGEGLHVLRELGGELLVGEGMLGMAGKRLGAAPDHGAFGHLVLARPEVPGFPPLLLAGARGRPPWRGLPAPPGWRSGRASRPASVSCRSRRCATAPAWRRSAP